MVQISDFNTKGACYTFDYSVFPDDSPAYYPFFGREGEGRKGMLRREKVARAICSGCTVVEQCLQFALERETSSRVDGFFGGKGEDERKEILRAQRVKEAA